MGQSQVEIQVARLCNVLPRDGDASVRVVQTRRSVAEGHTERQANGFTTFEPWKGEKGENGEKI